jgi:hypothetical protein
MFADPILLSIRSAILKSVGTLSEGFRLKSCRGAPPLEPGPFGIWDEGAAGRKALEEDLVFGFAEGVSEPRGSICSSPYDTFPSSGAPLGIAKVVSEVGIS